MSDNEDAATDTAPMNDAKSTGRWVWGSLGAVCLLWIFAACTPWLNKWLGSRGEVGDFLGGVSAPVFGFVGMVLVYRSFQAQVKANQLQIEALKAEREAREADLRTQEKQVRKREAQELEQEMIENLANLDKIVGQVGYLRCHRDPHMAFQGVSGIYHFCKDACHESLAGSVYEQNGILLDILGWWLMEANYLLHHYHRLNPELGQAFKARLFPVYAFTLSSSLNTLIDSHGFCGADFEEAIARLKERKEGFDRALDGQFEPEASA